jgi:hypothetical protein
MKITFSSCDVPLLKRSLSCGTSVTGETPNGAERQEAHRTPRGKRATWNANQLLSNTTTKFLRKQLLYYFAPIASSGFAFPYTGAWLPDGAKKDTAFVITV